MSEEPHQASRDECASDPTECPHCGEVTLPNVLSDGSVICSCPAQRGLQSANDTTGSPPPVDDPAFVSDTGAAPTNHPKELPDDAGQFGTDRATERYRPMDPPAERHDDPARDHRGQT
jgi:hypothetical protein